MGNIQLTAAEIAALKNGEVPETVIEKLPKTIVPASWESLERVSGFYVNGTGAIQRVTGIKTLKENRTTFPSESLAESHGIAAPMLAQLINAMYEEEKAKELRKTDSWKIVSAQSGLRVIEYRCYHLLSFETEAHAEQFLNTHRKLIMKYYEMEGGEL